MSTSALTLLGIHVESFIDEWAKHLPEEARQEFREDLKILLGDTVDTASGWVKESLGAERPSVLEMRFYRKDMRLADDEEITGDAARKAAVSWAEKESKIVSYRIAGIEVAEDGKFADVSLAVTWK